jgi:hypothetical protein
MQDEGVKYRKAAESYKQKCEKAEKEKQRLLLEVR